MARKECYLYVQTIPHLFRVNLSDLCESGSSPQFEIAYDYTTADGRVPIGMAPIVVGSKIYMVGGEKAKKGSMLFDVDGENWLNTTDVYVFDHTKSESEDRLVTVRDGDGAALGRLNGPKCKPIVFTFEEKFYLLSRKPYLRYLSSNLPIFEVFDPTLPNPSWKVLPNQPNFPSWDYFAWGHKLLPMPFPMSKGFFIFDAKKEEWTEDWEFIGQFTGLRPTYTPVPTNAGVEFKGIVFAMSAEINAVVAYDLDSDGHLKAHWVLNELSEVFQYSPLDPAQGFLTDLGGGRMCLLFSGEDMDDNWNWIVRVHVFRVDIATVGERPVVHREIMRSFILQSWNDFSPVIDSVFVCDHSNKSDIEADASSSEVSSEARPPALAKESVQSCEDLKKRHAIEYVTGDSKKAKSTLLE